MNKLDGINNVLWINLEKSKYRRELIEKQFESFNIDNVRIKGFDATNENRKLKLNVTNTNKRYHKGQYGALISHLMAIEYYLQNYDDDYMIIMEDDVSFEFVELWNKSIKQVIEKAPNDWEILQISHLLYKKEFQEFVSDVNLYKKWKWGYYGAAAYIISRDGAKKIIDKFKRGNKYIVDHRCVLRINADYLIFNTVTTYSYHNCLFTYFILPSTIVNHDHKIPKCNSYKLWKEFPR
jgi:GR25 family glycosyltransferase involved in LPS biosynthesis